jgi:serine/threonine protein phosphatase PrpC
MEDTCLYQDVMNGSQLYTCFALFDGHGGPDASATAAHELSLELARRMPTTDAAFTDEACKEALLFSFEHIDKRLQMSYESQGTTALIALIARKHIYLSWVGDSRALVFSQDGQIKLQTNDHKPDSENELERIGAENIFVSHLIKNVQGKTRVVYTPYGHMPTLTAEEEHAKRGPARIGGLSLSRALGDKRQKESEPLILALPEVTSGPLSAGDYLVLACDGLWDVMSNEQVVEFIIRHATLSVEELKSQYGQQKAQIGEISKDTGSDEKMILIASALRDKAYELNSTDNISVMIVKL